MVTALLAVLLASTPAAPEAGISEGLARERAAAVRDLRYDVVMHVPAARTEPVTGRVIARFVLAASGRIVLDFARPREAVRAVRLDGREVPYDVVNGHIVIASAAAGPRELAVDFVAGDEALNRSDEFLYTLFVPARARLAFPCFDQPDLKARYTLTLTAPAGWQAVSNGAAVTRTAADSAAPATLAFAETQPLPTYLFAFAAGRFTVETAERGGREMRMFHRETDAAKVARNRDAIFDLHASALRWLEDYTAIPYPFGKFDIVAIPSFTFGGMEHAGAIFYNASGLLLDESATQNQMLDRANVIAHETSHMWFGDLVTMRWFNDVWMKEVFANFMADKIVNPSFPDVNHELRFLLAHYPSAYGTDRTAGTNAIRQVLDNLDQAGQMYGPIIYDKAPIVMRQLEMIMGPDAFRDGLRDYLKTYQFGNATWIDLVRTLDARTPRDLAAWSRAWVEERGRPSITTRVRMANAVRGPGSSDPGNRVASITLSSRDSMGRGLVWPQRLIVSMGDESGVTHVPVDMRGATAAVPGVEGRARPAFVLANGAGLGYGLFVLDDASRAYLLDHVERLPDPLLRGSAWVTLWDNMVEGAIAPPALLDTALRALPAETDEQNVQRILGYAARAYWRYLLPDQRQARAGRVETVFRAGLAAAATQSQKSAWFSAYRDTVVTPDGLAWLERVWRREERVPGLTLAEPDEITLAMELAVREVPRWREILETQLARTQNPDRKERLAFVIPALSADPGERERSFERFRVLENRRREVWVQDSLQYLNHPLRAEHGQKFVAPALELLREIQRTGDIFFPTRWMERTLWGHSSPEVAATVRAFLAREKDYPLRLRWTILSTADDLFRASRAGASRP